MGAEFIVNTLEEMCDLMCGGIDPEEDKNEATIFDCPLPDDGQEALISIDKNKTQIRRC